MVWTTAVVAFGTLFYAGAAAFQIYVLKQSAAETSRQTDKLIEASDRLASIANQQADDARKANEEMLNKAERLTHANEELVKTATTQANASMSQANTSDVSARAAEKSAAIAEQAFTIGERPYMAVKQIKVNDFEKGKSPTVELVFSNSGKTPALNVHCRAYSTGRTERRLGAVKYPEVSNLSEGIVETQGSVKEPLIVMSEFSQEAKDTAIEAVKKKQIWIFVYGIVDYDDGAGRHHVLKFCHVYNAESGDMEICEEHNTSN